MPDMENSQLDEAIRKEMGLSGKEGTNSETEATAEKEEPADARADEPAKEEKEASEPAEAEGNKEKRRGNVPKILRERNELRRKVQDLENQLKERAETSSDEAPEQNVDLDSRIREIMQAEREAAATKEFFESNSDAKAQKKAIESLMDDHGLQVRDAWLLYQAKNDPKSLTKNQTKATSSPSVPNFGNRKDKTVASMKVDDIEAELRNQYKRGELSI
jgi:hypothetical protein